METMDEIYYCYLNSRTKGFFNSESSPNHNGIKIDFAYREKEYSLQFHVDRNNSNTWMTMYELPGYTAIWTLTNPALVTSGSLNYAISVKTPEWQCIWRRMGKLVVISGYFNPINEVAMHTTLVNLPFSISGEYFESPNSSGASPGRLHIVSSKL